jgi:hypothetical protein
MGPADLVTNALRRDKHNRLTVASLEFGFLEFAVRRILAETSESKAAIRLCKTVGKRVESEHVND